MARKKKAAPSRQPRTVRVEIGGALDKITGRKIGRAILKKLGAKATDLFAHDDTLVLLVQHQVRRKRAD